jgi:small conductance mechanosensitive channel
LLSNFLANTLFFFFVTLGVVTSLGILGFSGTVTKILAGAGISGFIIGFAFKDIGENFLAGILLAFKRPFSIGDTIETNGLTGTVYDFKLRETLIKTSDGIDAFIPNSIIIKNILKNHTLDHLLRKEFVVG